MKKKNELEEIKWAREYEYMFAEEWIKEYSFYQIQAIEKALTELLNSKKITKY